MPVIYSKDWEPVNMASRQAKIGASIYAKSSQRKGLRVVPCCNYPHPDYQLTDSSSKPAKNSLTDSVAIHTYHRCGKLLVSSPEDLKKGPASDYKELLLTIYENRTSALRRMLPLTIALIPWPESTSKRSKHANK
ncbi:hypothetical protein BV898_18789 [Hypsibius exemplaris]|uniref:Uncharacterized protein n=1 Tax=Hypsibius exemplaris TaxID=2072580 RepID=A0A9X6NI50_HYPEX|nr:hypothetical protein BV898_18789 [Hypsibius exemplaris]